MIMSRHLGPAWQISWAHPRYGNILASCGFDHKINIWKDIKRNEWELMQSFEHHKASGKRYIGDKVR